MTTRQRAPRAPSAARGHDLWALGQPLAPGRETAPNPRQSRFEQLLTVEIQHGYFSSRGGVCPSFLVRPAPSSIARFRGLGLRHHDTVGAFSGVYDVGQREALVSALRRQRTAAGAWVRLSFLLTVQGGGSWINATDIPLELHPSTHNFYFSNRQSHRDGERVLLQPGSQVTHQALLPVVPTRYSTPVASGVDAVLVVDVSGAVVEKVETHGQERVVLDFSLLPLGAYTLRQVARGETEEERRVLWTVGSLQPLAFVDLFLSRPTPSGRGVFPIDLEAAEVAPVTYELVFGTRRATWIYLVVPSAPKHGERLSIRSRDPEISFRGPRLTHLSNGRRAYEFVSRRPLPLFDHSPYRFELWEESLPVPRCVARCLPVPSPSSVQPRDGPEATQVEMLVGI